MTDRYKVIFMGTPAFAVSALDAIVDAGHEVVCVYSQPPRPAGRGHKEKPSPVHARALELGLPVRTPAKLKKNRQALDDFAALEADIAVVAAYGLILPQSILDGTKQGCLNIHASLLPRWRGAAPIQRAILAGDDKTGICIMQMDAGLDTGAVLLHGETPITQTTTATALHDALAAQGADLIVNALENYDSLTHAPQTEEGATYAHMLKKEEGRIDWAQDAADIERQVRALNPWPGVWGFAGLKRLKILKVSLIEGMTGQPGTILDSDFVVACGAGAVRLDTVQPEGKKPMSGIAFLNGASLNVGDLLS